MLDVVRGFFIEATVLIYRVIHTVYLTLDGVKTTLDVDRPLVLRLFGFHDTGTPVACGLLDDERRELSKCGFICHSSGKFVPKPGSPLQHLLSLFRGRAFPKLLSQGNAVNQKHAVLVTRAMDGVAFDWGTFLVED